MHTMNAMNATTTTGSEGNSSPTTTTTTTTRSKTSFLKLPPELLEYIILHLVAQSPFDVFVVYSPTPPSPTTTTTPTTTPLLLPLRLTCRSLNTLITSDTFKAKAFPVLFDIGAAERRNFTLSRSMKADQWDVWGRVIAWVGDKECVDDEGGKREGEGETSSGRDDETAFTLLTKHPWNIAETLLQAYLMLLSDDGKNRAQLEHAGLYPLLKQYLLGQRHGHPHLYSHLYNAWPIESHENSCCLWLLWMLTTDERLKSESQEEKERIIDMVSPWVLVPFRYPLAHAPATHYNLPLSPTLFVPVASSSANTQTQRRTQPRRGRRSIPSYDLPHSIMTAHGPYPVYERSFPSSEADLSTAVDGSEEGSTTMPPAVSSSTNAPHQHELAFQPTRDSMLNIPFFSCHRPFSVPPPSLAATLLYFSRRELNPFGIPPHLPATREIADRHFRERLTAELREQEAVGQVVDWRVLDNSRREAAPTKEDIAEFNGFKGAQLPFETKWYDSWEGWGKGEGVDGWHDDTASNDGLKKWRASPGIAGPWNPTWLNDPILGEGRFPHPPAPSSSSAEYTTWHESIPPSVRYDNDYFRARYCYDPFLVQGRRNGDVHTPGLIDGLWQGRMLVPSEGPFLNLIHTRDRPRNFGEAYFFTMTVPVFMRLKEWHWVRGSRRRGALAGRRGPHRMIEVEEEEDGDLTPTAETIERKKKLVPWHRATSEQRVRDLHAEEDQEQGGGGPIPAATRRERVDEGMRHAWFPEGCVCEERGDNLDVTLPHITSLSVTPSLYERYRRGQPNSHESEYCVECLRRESESELLRNVGRMEADEALRDRSREEGPKSDSQVDEEDEDEDIIEDDTIEEDAGFLHSRFGGAAGYEKIWQDIGLGRALKRKKGETPGRDYRSRTDIDDDYRHEFVPRAEDDNEGMDVDDADDGATGGGGTDAEWMDVDEDADADDDDASSASDFDDPTNPPDDPHVSPPCTGIADILITGSTDASHAAAWHSFVFRGRVRKWDGLVGILRVSRDRRMGDLVFCGYVVGGRNFVGRWRAVGNEGPGRPAWEGAFAMCRRE